MHLEPRIVRQRSEERSTRAHLAGGLPEEVPELYDLASPIQHVSAASPPTLHFQGTNDHIVPVESARRLHGALSEAGVPAVYVEFPRTPHAFDLVIPPLLSPAGQTALYDLERFLACVATQARSVRVPSRETISANALAAATGG